MNRQDFLKLVSKEIHFVFDRKSIEKELNEHLEDSIADLREEGLSKEDAEKQAIAQMGEPEEIGKLLNQEHHPTLGYVWMITRVILIVAVIFTLVVGFESLQSALDILYPSQNMGWRIKESYPIRLKFETRNHNVIIDHVCRTEYDQYYITYRAKTKLEYLRSVSIYDPIFYVGEDLENSNGWDCNQSITHGRFGEKGYYMFEWPDDNILYLYDGNNGGLIGQPGEVIELDLGEYWR